ncbi:MAG TPA: ribonuclease HII [Armatimonadota bacterium]|jgi:ribonuclease HII
MKRVGPDQLLPNIQPVTRVAGAGFGIPPMAHEAEIRALGYGRVAGVDEAGRGPLAGPVVAAAVVLVEDGCPPGVADSKVLTPARREEAYRRIVECACWAVGMCSPEEIDALNILRATHLAMRRALEGLSPCADFALVDGLPAKGLPLPNRCLVKGERQSASIAAASIIAKVTRDRLMLELHERYPIYNFARHKGYPTPEHVRALELHGPCPVHRRSFAPVRENER